MLAGSRLADRTLTGANAAVSLAYRVLPGGGHRCPCCGYTGRFAPTVSFAGVRPHAACPSCRLVERHRLQAFAFEAASEAVISGRRRVLHVAPETVMGRLLRGWAEQYVTADFAMSGVDLQLDLRDMPQIRDGSVDLLWASHVLEHIDDDKAALAEVYRALAPGGVAVLPVPLVAEQTVDYDEPSPAEAYHVRAPGPDYFDRYREIFDEVEVIWSSDAPDEIQPWVYENRERFPNKLAPARPPMTGKRHLDAVPICRRLR